MHNSTILANFEATFNVPDKNELIKVNICVQGDVRSILSHHLMIVDDKRYLICIETFKISDLALQMKMR